MRKGISIWSFSGADIKENLKLAKEAGFEGVELALDETGDVSMESTKEQILDIKAYGESLGLEFYSVASALYWTYNYTSANEEYRNKAIAITKKQLEVASWLGCNTILVVPGAITTATPDGTEIVDYDVAYERAGEALKQLAPMAEELGVYIGVENVWNQFLLSPLEMARFIDEIGSKYVAAYFDVGNVLYIGYPQQWIKILGDRIKKVHIKDYSKPDEDGCFGFKDLLAGDVDWKCVMDEFEKIGYDGWITAEMLPPYKNYPEALIYNTSNAMDYILGRK